MGTTHSNQSTWLFLGPHVCAGCKRYSSARNYFHSQDVALFVRRKKSPAKYVAVVLEVRVYSKVFLWKRVVPFKGLFFRKWIHLKRKTRSFHGIRCPSKKLNPKRYTVGTRKGMPLTFPTTESDLTYHPNILHRKFVAPIVSASILPGWFPDMHTWGFAILRKHLSLSLSLSLSIAFSKSSAKAKGEWTTNFHTVRRGKHHHTEIIWSRFSLWQPHSMETLSENRLFFEGTKHICV